MCQIENLNESIDIDAASDLFGIDAASEFPGIDAASIIPDIDAASIFPGIDAASDFPGIDATASVDIDIFNSRWRPQAVLPGRRQAAGSHLQLHPRFRGPLGPRSAALPQLPIMNSCLSKIIASQPFVPLPSPLAFPLPWVLETLVNAPFFTANQPRREKFLFQAPTPVKTPHGYG